jgi:cytochrome P450
VGLLERVARECGPIGAFHLGPRRVVVVSDPDVAHAILVERAAAFEKGPTVRVFLRPLFGEGLIAAKNAPHRRRRRVLQPAFHPRELAGYAASMAADARAACAAIADGQTFDLGAFLNELTLRIVGRALFALDLAREEAELRAVLDRLQDHATRAMRSLAPLPLWMPTPNNRVVRRGRARHDPARAGFIAVQRRRPPEAPQLTRRLSVVDEDGRGLSDEEVRDELVTLLVAGHETVASALSWTLALLLTEEDGAVYARLAADVRTALGDAAPGADDLPRLAGCERAMLEAMRLYPPVHSLGRVASEDAHVGSLALGAGDVVVVSTYLMHRRADLFPRPLAFEPTRFADGEAGVKKGTYLPFGAGPRVCIGAGFAMMEGVLVLATLLQRVRLERRWGTRPAIEMGVTLRPREPLLVRARRW